MENILGVQESNYSKEPLGYVLPKEKKPTFELVDEDETYTPEVDTIMHVSYHSIILNTRSQDAAKSIGRRPFAELQANSLTKEMLRDFTLDEKLKKKKTTIVRKDKNQKSKRFRFVFIDTTNEVKG